METELTDHPEGGAGSVPFHPFLDPFRGINALGFPAANRQAISR
jgi:hypothetical protein